MLTSVYGRCVLSAGLPRLPRLNPFRSVRFTKRFTEPVPDLWVSGPFDVRAAMLYPSRIAPGAAVPRPVAGAFLVRLAVWGRGDGASVGAVSASASAGQGADTVYLHVYGPSDVAHIELLGVQVTSRF
jgi:hypothetical protein